jgi:hypothetical protein
VEILSEVQGGKEILNKSLHKVSEYLESTLQARNSSKAYAL